MLGEWELSGILRTGLALLVLAGVSADAGAHGGVFLEDDVCVIQIGFFRAHFTIYQPRTSASEEFCEDIPDVTESVFVLDYLHKSLREMPVDFRVIKDATELGRFAKWEDIERLGDLESVTVFYQPPLTTADAVFSVEHTFEEAGHYIGIVTTRNSTLNKTYNAVFPFEVGATGFGYWPWILLLLVVVQLQYLISSGTLKRWRARRATA